MLNGDETAQKILKGEDTIGTKTITEAEAALLYVQVMKNEKDR